MPWLYGEGERSFVRLQGEIMKSSDDYSLFAWRSARSFGGALATSPASFVDSENIFPTESFQSLSESQWFVDDQQQRDSSDCTLEGCGRSKSTHNPKLYREGHS